MTIKQIQSCLKFIRQSGLDGMCANEAYLKETEGITFEMVRRVENIMTDLYGMKFNWPKGIKVPSIIKSKLKEMEK